VNKPEIKITLSYFTSIWKDISRWCSSETKKFIIGQSSIIPLETLEQVMDIPVIDSKDPENLRKKVLFDMLIKYLPLLNNELSINYTIESDLFKLVQTFSIFHPVTVYTPVYCMTFLLLFISVLSINQVPQLKLVLIEKEEKIISLYNQYGLTQAEFTSLMQVFLSQ